jgi:hypothetical protein
MSSIVLAIVYAVMTAVFAFQLWSVLRTGHVRWRAQKVHRAHRPLAFAAEIVACGIGFLLFAGLLVATLLRH